MKSKIIFGCLALAFVVINVTLNFQNRQEGYALSQLLNVAIADEEGGGSGDCHTDENLGGQLFDCENGHQYGERWGTLTCAGSVSGQCLSGTYYYLYSCDGTMVGSDDVQLSTCL